MLTNVEKQVKSKRLFAWANMVVSGCLFLFVFVLKMVKIKQGKPIQRIEQIIPDYQSDTIVTATTVIFLASITLPFSLLGERKNSLQSKAYQQWLCVAHVLVLGLVSAVGRNFALLPQQILFFMETVYGTQNPWLKKILLSNLIIELPLQWILFFVNIETKDNFGTFGIFTATNQAKIGFFLKMGLFVIEYDRKLLDIKQDQNISKPFSRIFCLCGILFCLFSPAIQFIPLIPILGFVGLTTTKSFRVILGNVLGLLSAFTLTLYSYQLYYLMQTETPQRGQNLAHMFGFEFLVNLETLFPSQYECFFLLVMMLSLQFPYIFEGENIEQQQVNLVEEPFKQQNQQQSTSLGKLIDWFHDFFKTCILELTLHIHSIGLGAVLFFLLYSKNITLIQLTLFLVFTYQLILHDEESKLLSWYLQATNCVLILLSQYITRLFQSHQSKFWLQVVGLVYQPGRRSKIEKQQNLELTNVSLYAQAFIVLAICIFVIKILHSQTYSDLSTEYYTWEELMKPQVDHIRLQQQHYDEDIGMVTQVKSLKKIGILSYVMIWSNIYLLLWTLAFSSVTMPLSITSFVQLSLMTILVIKSLSKKQASIVYQTTGRWIFVLLQLTGFVTIIAQLVSRVLIQFKLGGLLESYPEYETPTNAEWWQIIMGIDENLFKLRMSVFFFTISLATSSLLMQKNPVAFNLVQKVKDQILQEEQSEAGIFKRIIVYYVYGLALALPVILLVVVFTIALAKPSLWGILSLITTMFLIWYEQNDFWRKSYFAIGVWSQIEAIITYFFDFILKLLDESNPQQLQKPSAVVEMPRTTDLAKSFLKSNSQVISQEEQVERFNQLSWLFLIIFFCFLQQTLIKLSEDFKVAQNRKLIDQCLKFKQKFLEVFVYTQGITLVLLLLLITMYSKRNVTSLLYLIIFIRIVSLNYFPNRYNDGHLLNADNISKAQTAKRWLGYLIFLTTSLILLEYVITALMWKGGLSDINSESNWSKFVTNRLCYITSENGLNLDCLSDWNNYFMIGKNSIKVRFFVWQIILLLQSYITRAYVQGKIMLNDDYMLPPPKVGDELDFTTKEKGFLVDKILYMYFPYYLITNILACLSNFGTRGNSTFISCYYLVLVFSIGIRFRKLFTKNIKFIRHLRILNMLVLFIMLIFQAPLFPCPYEKEGKITYISLAKCPPTTPRNGETNPYVLLMQTLGIQKFQNTQLSFIMVYIVTEIQAWLFSSPSFQVYVIGRQNYQKMDSKMRAYMLVQDYHLNIRWKFEAAAQEIKILHKKLQRTLLECQNVVPKEFVISEQYKLLQNQDQTLINVNSIICEQICQNNLNGNVPPVDINQLEKYQPQAQAKNEEIERFYQEKTNEIQQQVLNENKTELMYTDGLGLKIGINSLNFIDDDYQFFKNVFVTNNKESLLYLLSESPNDSVNDGSNINMLLEETSQIDENVLQVKQQQVIEQQQQDETIFGSLDKIMRQLLFSMSNQLMLISVQDPQTFQPTHGTSSSYIRLILGALEGQIEYICIFMMIAVFAQNSNAITLVYPICSLFYCMLAIKSSKRFWDFVTWYTLITIMLKLLIQLPLFCSSPVWSVRNCSNVEIQPEILIKRIDFLIGLQKLSGPSSYPKNQGIFTGIFCDLILMVLLVNLRRYMWWTGRWKYIINTDNIQTTPRFKLKDDKVQKENQEEFQQSKLTNIFSSIKAKLLILFPQYLDENQPNLDIRTNQDQPYQSFNYARYKPGRDYFNGNFYSLLAILFCTILFYKSIVGLVNNDIGETVANPIDLNRFTVGQVLLIFSILCLMLIERMMYRAKQGNDWSKHILLIRFIIYITEVVIIHVLFAFVWPFRGLRLSVNFSVKMYYLLWVIHFIFSALQIRYGYPTEPHKQFFMRDTNQIMVWFYRAYSVIPFIWEMKVITDWTVTKTCLDLYQWFRIDDVAQYIYFNKYQSDNWARRPEFQNRDFKEKITEGFCFAFLIILIILAPILVFSGINPGMVPNPVQAGSLQIKFNLNNIDYYIFATQISSLETFNRTEVKQFNKDYKVVDNTEDNTLQKAEFFTYSEQNWLISDPMLDRLLSDYQKQKSQKNVQFTSMWRFDRSGIVGDIQTSGHHETQIQFKQLSAIIQMLQESRKPQVSTIIQEASVQITQLLPKMLRLNKGQTSNILNVVHNSGATNQYFSDVTLILNKGTTGNFYWTFTPAANSNNTYIQSDQGEFQVLLYNESVVKSMFFDSVTFSVIGLYTIVVYALGSMLRRVFDRISERVIYENLPNTERLREICEGIFIAQTESDFESEKYLYDLLITIYRSPELMLKMTGIKVQYPPPDNEIMQEQQNSEQVQVQVEEENNDRQILLLQ